VHVETGVALSSKTIIPFVMCCVFMDDLHDWTRVCCVYIYMYKCFCVCKTNNSYPERQWYPPLRARGFFQNPHSSALGKIDWSVLNILWNEKSVWRLFVSYCLICCAMAEDKGIGLHETHWPPSVILPRIV